MRPIQELSRSIPDKWRGIIPSNYKPDWREDFPVHASTKAEIAIVSRMTRSAKREDVVAQELAGLRLRADARAQRCSSNERADGARKEARLASYSSPVALSQEDRPQLAHCKRCLRFTAQLIFQLYHSLFQDIKNIKNRRR